MSQINFLTDIELFPNPFVDELQIQFYLDKSSQILFNIYSNNGQLVESIDKGKLQGGAVNAIIDLSYLEHGIFYIQVLSNEQIIATEKVIKE